MITFQGMPSLLKWGHQVPRSPQSNSHFITNDKQVEHMSYHQ